MQQGHKNNQNLKNDRGMRPHSCEHRLVVKRKLLIRPGLWSVALTSLLHTMAGLAFPNEPLAAIVPKRAVPVTDRQLLPHSEKMIVFGVEPVDIGPGQRDAFKDLSQVEWVVPGDIFRKDYPFHKETLYLATNPRPYQGGGYLYLFPDRFPDAERKYTEVRLIAAPGEYESGSFCIWPQTDAQDATVTVEDLRHNQDHRIPSTLIDLRIVKWLYLPMDVSEKDRKLGQTVFQPLLLVHDDGLINPVHLDEEGYARGRNRLKHALNEVVDTDWIQPFDLHQQELRQLWLTVRVPHDAPAGDYHSKINVTTGDQSVTLPLVLTVLPFHLSPSRWMCGLYYAGGFKDVRTIEKDRQAARRADPMVYQAWRNGHSKFVHSYYKSDEQIKLELLDMAAHGVTHAAFYCSPERMVHLMEETKFGDGKTYFSTVKSHANEQTIALLKQAGFTDIYIASDDEPRELRSLQSHCRQYAQLGAKCFSSLGISGMRPGRGFKVQPLVEVLDHPNFRTRYTIRDELPKWKAAGKTATVYGSPYPWLHRFPLAFRVGYGLGMWRYGYGGSFDFAYQWHGPRVWDLFSLQSDSIYQIGYTLPTLGEPVSTLMWECFRQGNNDLRYLSTLMDRIEARRSTQPDDAAAEAAQKAIDELQMSTQFIQTGNRDLQDLRLELVKHILALSDVPSNRPSEKTE